MVNIKKLIKSFGIAFSGLFYAVKNENTIKAGVIIAVVVLFFTFYYPLSNLERAIVFLTIFVVLGMEMMNMQIENTADLIDTNYNRQIKVIKDVAAGAVLMTIIVAAIVAAFIFLPYILK